MSNASSKTSRLGNRFQGLKDRVGSVRALADATERRELVERFGKPLLQPKFIPERYFEGVSRSSQWFAAVLLSVVVPVSLVLIVAIDTIIVDLFLNGEDFEQLTFLSFLVNLIGLFFFCLAAWSWFIWVRTGGFGFFEM